MAKKRNASKNASTPSKQRRREGLVFAATTRSFPCDELNVSAASRDSRMRDTHSFGANAAMKEEVNDLIIDGQSSHDPWYLPYTVQHDLHIYLQRELENMCQRFGQAHFPKEMHGHKWTELGSMELTAWIKFIRRNDITSTPGPFKPTEQSILDQMLSAISDIRHSAVHRLSKGIHYISRCVLTAEMFAELHYDTDMANTFSNLSKACQVIFDQDCSARQRTKADLEKSLAEGKRKLEQKALEEFERKTGDWRRHVGHSLGRFLSETSLGISSAEKDREQPSEDFLDSAYPNNAANND